MDSKQARDFFRAGFQCGNKRLSAFVRLADHEFNSQVSLDEATGKWQVVKKVEETSLFDSEQEAIEWSTQPIGSRPPEQPTVQPQDIERTPLKEPISTDEQLIQPEESQPTDTEPSGGSGSGLFKETEEPKTQAGDYQEASSFEPTAKINSQQVTGKQKDLMTLEVLSRNLRKAGNSELAKKIDQLKEDQYFESSEKLEQLELARIYAKAYIDSLTNNRYASANSYSSALSALMKNYNLTEESSSQLLTELNFPKKLIPNYFE